MNKTKRKKTKKLIIISICICILIFMIVIFLNKTKNVKTVREITTNSTIPLDRGRTEKGQLIFNGASVFVEMYNGELKLSEILKELNTIIKNRIPKTYNLIKNYDDNNLEIFFENNKRSLKNMYGVQTSEEFIELAKKLQEQSVDFYKYLKLNINSETFSNDCDKEGYSYVEAELEYEDGTILPMIIYIARFLDTEPNYIVKIK